MFKSSVIKKKKHSKEEEMEPKEAYEISEEKEQYRKPSSDLGSIKTAASYNGGSLIGANKVKYESNPSLSAKIPSGQGLDIKTLPIQSSSIYKSADIKGSPIYKSKSVAVPFNKDDYKSAIEVPSMKMPSMKEMIGETGSISPKDKPKMKGESAVKLEALIKSSAKKPIPAKKKGEIIMMEEGKPASKRDEKLLKEEYIKRISKKAK